MCKLHHLSATRNLEDSIKTAITRGYLIAVATTQANGEVVRRQIASHPEQ
ncbi:MAG TPA: hypothetical protein V6D03_04085 [Candidatus Caenarcaniphilales bacterium]